MGRFHSPAHLQVIHWYWTAMGTDHTNSLVVAVSKNWSQASFSLPPQACRHTLDTRKTQMEYADCTGVTVAIK